MTRATALILGTNSSLVKTVIANLKNLFLKLRSA